MRERIRFVAMFRVALALVFLVVVVRSPIRSPRTVLAPPNIPWRNNSLCDNGFAGTKQSSSSATSTAKKGRLRMIREKSQEDGIRPPAPVSKALSPVVASPAPISRTLSPSPSRPHLRC
jgi:hypothetical protein